AFKASVIATVWDRSGRTLSAVPGRIGVHSSLFSLLVKTVCAPVSSSNATQQASPAQGSKEDYSSSILSVGSSDSWDCTIVRPIEDHLLFPVESSYSAYVIIDSTIYN